MHPLPLIKGQDDTAVDQTDTALPHSHQPIPPVITLTRIHAIETCPISTLVILTRPITAPYLTVILIVTVTRQHP